MRSTDSKVIRAQGNWRIHPIDAPSFLFGPFLKVVEQWRSKCRAGRFPNWSDYDITDFAGWYGWISLNRIDPTARDVFVELFGTRMAEALGMELTGRNMRDPTLGVSPDHAERVFSHFNAVISTPGIGLRSISLAPMAREHVSGWILDLPVAKSDGPISHVMTFAARTSTGK